MTALRLLMLVPVGAAAIGLVASAQTAALPILIKGIAYQSYRSGAFGDRTQEPVLDAMKSSGANYVMMSTFFFWDDATKKIGSRSGWTDFSGLPTAISRVRQRGLKPALYVFVRTSDNDGFYGTPPNDTAEFFRHFGNLILGHADLAQHEGIDLLVIGNELNSIAGPAHREQWEAIIAEVRQRYRGRISYGAIPNYFVQPTLTEINRVVSFWNSLDLIGFSVYPQLTDLDVPDRGQIENGWTTSFYTNSNILRNLKAWNTLTGKPILFTEIGYRSADGAGIDPGRPPGGIGTPNGPLQALLYDVMFSQVMSEGGSWLEGMFLWALDTWNPQNDPFMDQRYRLVDSSFFEKPAADVVQKWYSAGGDSTPARRPRE